MAYKALIFGTDEAYEKLKPFLETAIKRGDFEIAARGKMEGNSINLVYADDKLGGAEDIPNFDLAIIVFPHPRNDFYGLMKLLESLGMPRGKIIDGFVFKMPNLDFPRLLKEGVAYGVFETKDNFSDITHSIYPRAYTFKNNATKINFGIKSMLNANAHIEGRGVITVGNFSDMAWRIFFELGINVGHNHKLLTSTHPDNFDWAFPKEFRAPGGRCQIKIGNDVWIGRGCILKCTNPKKPLVIGDGAVVASDSVVVKDVPPYAIVGGNPAQIIKYRFPPDVIEALLRIKWWDWSLDKIHDNFKYFNDIDKFISLHDETYLITKDLPQYVTKFLSQHEKE